MFCCCLVTKSCPTLLPTRLFCPWDSKQEYWRGLLFSSPGNPPDPEMKPISPPLAGRSFTTEPPRRPLCFEEDVKIYCKVNLKEKETERKGRREKRKQELKSVFSTASVLPRTKNDMGDVFRFPLILFL